MAGPERVFSVQRLTFYHYAMASPERVFFCTMAKFLLLCSNVSVLVALTLCPLYPNIMRLEDPKRYGHANGLAPETRFFLYYGHRLP